MLIARINLDLGVSKSDLQKKAKKLERSGIDMAKGTAHRYFVREVYQNDRAKYIERICRLVSQAVRAGAAIVQLPGIALLFDDRRVKLRDYACNFPSKSSVVAGILNASRLGHKGDNREGSVVLKNRTELRSISTNHRYMAACAGRLEKIPAIIAVSSTVKEVRTDRRYRFNIATEGDRRIIVLDLGHEQYTGHYKKLLISVYDHFKDRWGMKPTVILSQWRYAKSLGHYNWVVGGKGVTCHRLDQKENLLDQFKDEIELIKLSER